TDTQELSNDGKVEVAIVCDRRLDLERQMTAGQERVVSLRERRDVAAQNTSHHGARVAALEERHRSAAAVTERIESLVSEMHERVNELRTQVDSAASEKLQRETENQELATHLADLEAE